MTQDEALAELNKGVAALDQATKVAAAARGIRDGAIRELRPHMTVAQIQQLTGLSDSAVRKICDVA